MSTTGGERGKMNWTQSTDAEGCKYWTGKTEGGGRATIWQEFDTGPYLTNEARRAGQYSPARYPTLATAKRACERHLTDPFGVEVEELAS